MNDIFQDKGLHPSERTGLSNNIGDCKKSLSDIQDRIGSLQASLKNPESRHLQESDVHLPR